MTGVNVDEEREDREIDFGGEERHLRPNQHDAQAEANPKSEQTSKVAQVNIPHVFYERWRKEKK